MSRRESRASIGARQADALAEYENLKKKFLLANKHITKLNSTLSVRIEELNAEITVLQVENLRLRQSEISLLAQLKREREKSRKVMADAEAATLNLTKHLGYLRQSLNITTESTPPPSPAFPPATKPPLQTTNACIPGLRISKPPNVPGIHEEEEPCHSSSDNELENKTGSVRRKSRSKSRLSASKLPLPSRATSPPSTAPVPVPNMTPMPSRVDFTGSSGSTKRKSSRRQSGLLSIDTENLPPPRPASPAFGSPVRLEAGRAEEAEEIAVITGNLEVDVEPEPEPQYHDLPPPVPKKEKRKSKSKDKEAEGERGEREYAADPVRSKERKRQREEDGDPPPEGTKGKLKDVTTFRAVLQSIDRNIVRDQDEVVVSTRTFLVPSPPPSSAAPVQAPHPPPSESEPEPTVGAGGRERRVRKSINYAEPKLNTKMRKPDPPPGAEPPRAKKRSSAAAIMTTTTYPTVPEPPPPPDVEPSSRASGELALRNAQEDAISPELYPLPPSRPQTAMYHSPLPPARSSGTSSSASSSGAATGSVRRKKSKPLIESDDEESDGAQADGEYIPNGRSSTWVNIEGRSRKTGERAKKSSIVMLGQTRRELVDERRHSMAV